MNVLCNLGKAKAHQRLNYYYNNFVGYSYDLDDNRYDHISLSSKCQITIIIVAIQSKCKYCRSCRHQYLDKCPTMMFSPKRMTLMKPTLTKLPLREGNEPNLYFRSIMIYLYQSMKHIGRWWLSEYTVYRYLDDNCTSTKTSIVKRIVKCSGLVCVWMT